MARLIGFRQSLYAGCSWQTQHLILAQCFGHIAGATAREASRERGSVLDRLRRALCHKRKHRMARISQECHPPHRPVRHRFAVKKCPDECFVNRPKNAAHLRVPTFIGGEQVGHLTAVSPRLLCPGVLLDDGNKVHQLSILYIGMHDMLTRPHPELRRHFKPEGDESIGWNQTTVGDTACKARFLRPEKYLSHDRMDAVRSHERANANMCTVLELGLYMFPVIY